jgi:hypothetical protein
MPAPMREEFPSQIKDVLAKRAGYRCSNPGCLQLTSGPQDDPGGFVNVGVAAHITAASPGGARFDPTLSPEVRRSVENGIWLCQNHAKLVDNDPAHYTVESLKEWKRIAEAFAKLEIEYRPHLSPGDAQRFRKAEQAMPALLMEMRSDLAAHPFEREFIVKTKGSVYNKAGLYLAYHLDEHEDLESRLQLLENLRLIRDVTYNNVKRFRFTEELVDYLTATNPSSA